MRVSPAPLLLVLLGACLAGCLRSKESVHLALDGSGRIDQVVLFDEAGRAAFVRALADLYEVPEDRRARLRCDPWDVEWIRAGAAAVKGYRVPLLEVGPASASSDAEVGGEGAPAGDVPAGARRTVLQGVFTTLADAARGGAFLGAGLRLERTPDRAWRLEFRDGWGWIGDDDRGEIGGLDRVEVRERLAPLLRGGSIERAVVFPTTVIDTNGELAADGVTVTWRLELGELLGEPTRKSWATFEASDDLVLESCRIDPDPTRLLQRLLEAPSAPYRVAGPEGGGGARGAGEDAPEK